MEFRLTSRLASLASNPLLTKTCQATSTRPPGFHMRRDNKHLILQWTNASEQRLTTQNKLTMEYSTYESRLATFEPPSKRSKLGWPHKTPTPEELAKAGFYYKPSSESNDNTICFMCGRFLDGWEADDDPIQEHVKHSSDCAWAILMDAGQNASYDVNNMEDPTGQHCADARRGTFAIGWPHESKRGWTCKTEKMVEAGWYYVPTPESDDFVSCTYCKLSLDGWEPKDSPFEEHYRRSPDCPFFHFAGTTAPSKRPKAKKGRASRSSRTSKASTRLSTQSNNTTMLSEGPSMDEIPDLDESIDTSITSVMSTMSTASTATTKGKRKGTGKTTKTAKKRAKTTRATRAKKAEPEPEPEPEPVEEMVEEMVEQQEPEEEETPTQAQPGPQVDPEPEALPEQQSLPSPVSGSRPDVAYPTIANSPGIPSSPRHLSPIGVPPQPSPTPIKTRAPPSATRPSATPRTATKSQPQPQPQPQFQAQQDPEQASPSPPSDIENAPPSARPASVHQLLTSQTQTIPLAPSSPGERIPTWNAADIELVFQPSTPQPADLLGLTGGKLSAEEQSMTVHEWIEHVAGQAESSLRMEAERVVGVFEREGQRAMGVLEAIKCV
ncbi:hypothetical protein LTR72_006905 [Exophiala xenobiotica]|nr:hypothetical protein LTR72_006905 [Exophiala xenobiotica]KAK5287089.1 hypothetical protein LTR14_009506 [Exophiala xenobiotica]KAK5474888.1 hypothetical protein LTR55_009506 [Exophiala xenobiotica]